MLFLKYAKSIESNVCGFISKYKKYKKKRSLQAHSRTWLQKKKRASCFASCPGSATVEATLAFPVFLCSLCMLLLMGQLLLTEARIQFAVARAADAYAAQKAVSRTEGAAEGEGEADASVWSALSRTAGLKMLFSSFYDSSPMDASCIQGGKAGIVVTDESKDELVQIKAAYCLRIRMPFFPAYILSRESVGRQRIYLGYTEHDGGHGKDGGELVYVAEHGSVYHTSPACSHIYLKISGDSVKKIIDGGKYKACEICMKNKKPDAIYVTATGEKYHSSLECSGLKRTIKAVRREDVHNMRPCSRCGAMGG